MTNENTATATTPSALQPDRAAEHAIAIIRDGIAHGRIAMHDIGNVLPQVYAAVLKLGQVEAVEEKPVPPVPVRKTVTPDHIVSLEDGKPYKSLKRHLSTRGLTPDEYRKKWGLPHDYPMVAANYAAQRSELAKSIGLGSTRNRKAA